MKSPKINPCIYRELAFDKGAKNIFRGERIVSSINGARKTE